MIHNLKIREGGSIKMNQGLVQYADALSIPHEISYPLIREFLYTIEKNGMEYCCTRFKAVKMALISEKAGLEYSMPWFAKRNRSTLKGAFGSLQTWCRGNWKRWSKAIRLIQIYTTLYSHSLTSKQEQKFLAGVNASPCVIPYDIARRLRGAVRVLKLEETLPLPKPLWLGMTNPLKRAPHANGKTYPEDQIVLESLSFTRYTQFGLYLRGRYPRIFNSVEAGIDLDDPRDSPDLIDYDDSVGKIGFIQEPGFKLRAVANPARVYQAAMQPLGSSLFRMLSRFDWDCTHNQEKAIPFIQAKLVEKTSHVYSVDLTGATDYFPLEVQMIILSEIFRKSLDHVHLFYDLCRGDWIYRDTVIKWKKGQPLGLYPSFPSFALAHGLLLYTLNDYSHGNDFFILGDDVVILDDLLYTRYRQCLEDFGCPISSEKSLESKTVAEFAGRLITPNSVVIQNKWRAISDDSFLDIVRNIGRKGKLLLRRRQRRIADFLWEVPSFMGGLGFNPNGKPLEERVYNALCLLGERELAGYLMSLNRKFSAMNYYDRSTFGRGLRFSVDPSGVEQTAQAYVSHLIPTLKQWYEVSGKNLYSVDPSLDLPIDSLPSALSLLGKYERIFGIG